MRRRLNRAMLVSLGSACGYGIVVSINKGLEGNCYAECTGEQNCNLKSGMCERPLPDR